MKLPRIDLDGLRGSLGSLSAIPLHLSGRQRKIARWAGMGLLALASFLITLKFAFPYERMKGRLIDALSEKYDVRVGDVGGGFLPGTIVFEDVVLRSRPESPEEKPSEIVVDELVLDLGLDFGILGALRKKASFDVEAELNGSEIAAEIEMSESLFEAHVETDGLALGKLPGVAAAVGLPMSGALAGEVDLRLPGNKWKNAEGRIVLDCDGCTVGDGVSKMTLSPSSDSGSSRRRRTSAAAAAWGATGVEVPRLQLGDTEVVVEITKGVGEIKSFAATSADGWLKIEGKIEFRDPFANSLFPGCMRFKLSDELKKRAPRFGNIEYTLSEKMRQADGSYALPTKGKLTELRWDVRRRCGGGSTDDREGQASDRPALSGRLPGDAPNPDLPPAAAMPIDPRQVPGGAPGEMAMPQPEAAPGEMPPGGSGPAMTDPNVPPGEGTATRHDAGAVPPGDVGGLRRMTPDEMQQQENGEVGQPAPPPPEEEQQQPLPEQQQQPESSHEPAPQTVD
jgi:type II secretion system protein N